ncbi:MAG: NAD-binding protein [Halobacteriota archaeon]
MEVTRRWTGARAAVLMTYIIGGLSIVTGIASITTPPSGPLVSVVPFPELLGLVVGITGTLTGFLVLVSAFGLRRGSRAAWYAAVVLLPVTAIQGLLQVHDAAGPLVVLSAVTLAVLLLNRSRFDQPLRVTASQIAAVVAIAGAQIYGTLGSFALREQFSDIQTLLDAFYFTVVTGTTVGYGDVTPLTSLARLFTISVLVVSVSSFAVGFGVLLTPAIEARLSSALGRMTESQLRLFEDHLLVLGYGELTESILDELGTSTDYLVVTPDAERGQELRDHGATVLVGDPSDDVVLRRAQVSEALAGLVATNDDAEDALTILTARQLNPELRIVAAATHRDNVAKLRRAGADTVISPATIGGRLLVRSALGDQQAEDVARRLLDDSDRSSDATR